MTIVKVERKKEIFLSCILVSVILSGMVGCASGETHYINSTVLNAENPVYIIEEPGTYIFDEDILNIPVSQNEDWGAIWIKTSDVVLDGQNHKLVSESGASNCGLFISASEEIGNPEQGPDLENITIRNIDFNSWQTTVSAYNINSFNLTGNTFSDTQSAISCYNINAVTIQGNTLNQYGNWDSSEYIYVYSTRPCSEYSICHNTIHSNGYAPSIKLDSGFIRDVLIQENLIIAEGDLGIESSAHNVVISDNTFQGEPGLCADLRGNGYVIRNNIFETSKNCIQYTGNDTVIEQNTFGSADMYCGLCFIIGDQSMVAENISVNGNTIYSESMGYIYGNRCNLTNNQYFGITEFGMAGVLFLVGDENIFCDSSISNIGLSIQGDNNEISKNIAIGNTQCNPTGIDVHGSNNIVEGNVVQGGGIGLSDATGNRISGNTISDGYTGINIHDSEMNQIFNNRIVHNQESGICIYSFNSVCSNEIYNNYFKNSKNVMFSSTPPACTWNIESTSGTNIIGGPFIGGNYWGSPDGSGFSDTAVDADGDGLSDTPYQIDSQNVDYFPLVGEPGSVQGKYFTFSYDTAGDPYTIEFVDRSDVLYPDRTIEAWTWDFGDGTSSEEKNPVHTFDEPGNYLLSLTLTDSESYTTTGHAYITVSQVEKLNCSSPPPGMEARVSGNYIVYSDGRNGNYDIYLYDLANDLEKQICTDPYHQFDPDISGRTVIWTDYRTSIPTIYSYDLDTGVEKPLSIQPAQMGRISGDYVIWVENPGSYEGHLYLYDLSSGILELLTTHLPWVDGQVSINDDKVVYIDNRNGRLDVFLYDIQAKQEIPICTDANEKYAPHVSGNTVVWKFYIDPSQKEGIATYDLETGITTTIDTTGFHESMCSPSSVDGSPIYGKYTEEPLSIESFYIVNPYTKLTSALIMREYLDGYGFSDVTDNMLLIGDWSSGKKELYRYTIPVDSGSSENQPPVASFNYEFPGSNTKNCPTSDDVITFFDNSWDPDDGDTITEWSWDFGDGETSDEQNPSHQYSQSGFYTVNLTVTDGNGAMGSYEEEILVNYPPVVDFTMDIEPPLIAGQIVHFTGTATDQDGTISELEWQVFSGSQPNPEIVSTDINMEYEFTTPDLYVITLMAIDDLGSTGIAGYVLVVNELEETLYFLMAPGIEFDGTTVTFDSASVDEFIGNVFSIDDDTLTIMMNGLTTTLVTDGFTEVNGILQGEVNSISVENAPLVREIADLGEVGASFKANITPENSPDLQDVIIAVSINETASTGVQTAYELAAVDASLDIVDIAYAFNIIGATLENGVDVMDATIVMTASESWVVSQGGPDQVRIFRYSEYDGTTEILEPIYVFDEIAGVYTFTAYSPNGLSVFSLVAVTEIIPDTAPPLISDLLATPNPASINTPVLVTVTVDDSLTGGSAIANVEYTLDGITWFPMTATDGAFDEMTESATVTLPGRASAEIVNILVRTTDAAGNNALSDPLLIAIYDPNGAFVTAGGWILSPEGAYMADATSTGKANLGLNCKYKKGTTIPTGETEFHLKAANLKFKATSYEWLVITGPKAIYRGSGTINENGLYGFQIVAVDGDISGGDDTFWIKIWDKATNALIYDNGAGSTTGEPGTSLGGGNVKIHK